MRGVACALAPDALVGALQMEAQYEQVGKAFIQHYYAAFDSNRAALADLRARDAQNISVRTVCCSGEIVDAVGLSV